jgi:predicted RND superfamily exporter protein
MKKGNEYRDPFMTNKVDEMVEKMKARGYVKRPATTVQAASTMANLERQKTGKPRDWDAAIIGWEANPDAEEVFRTVNKASIDDLSHATSVRKSAKNELGQSELSATTPERRLSAIHHFEVAGSVAAEKVDLAKVTGIEPIKSEAPKEEIRKLSAWQAFKVWLVGGKVWEGKE